MKKHLFLFLTWACCAMLCVSLTSCPGPDPEPDPDPTPTPVANAPKLVAVGDYTLSYDSKGRFVNAKGRYDGVNIDYVNGKICCTYGSDEVETGNIKFNKDGLISEINTTSEDFYGDYEYHYSTSGLYSYDSKGYLLKVEFKDIEKKVDYNSGKTIGSDLYEWNIYFTWTDGNLTKVMGTVKKDYDGEYDSYSYAYYLTYSDIDNVFNQYMYGVVEELEFCEYFSDILPVVGLLGKGPAKMPIMMVEEVSDSDYKSSFEISCTLNENGTIASETFDGDKYFYFYSTNGDSRASFAEVEQPVKVSDREAKPGHHKRHKRHLRSIK